MTFNPTVIFQRSERHEEVRWIHIGLLRLLYGLMFFVLGRTTWTEILTHQGTWVPDEAVVWCVWTAFATLAGLGIIRPLKWLPAPIRPRRAHDTFKLSSGSMNFS